MLYILLIVNILLLGDVSVETEPAAAPENVETEKPLNNLEKFKQKLQEAREKTQNRTEEEWKQIEQKQREERNKRIYNSIFEKVNKDVYNGSLTWEEAEKLLKKCENDLKDGKDPKEVTEEIDNAIIVLKRQNKLPFKLPDDFKFFSWEALLYGIAGIFILFIAVLFCRFNDTFKKKKEQ